MAAFQNNRVQRMGGWTAHRDERHDSGSKGPRRNGSSLIAALWLRLSESSCRSRSEESGLRMSQILPLALLALGRGLRLPLGQDRGISAAATGGMWCCRKQGRGRPVCLQGSWRPQPARCCLKIEVDGSSIAPRAVGCRGGILTSRARLYRPRAPIKSNG